MHPNAPPHVPESFYTKSNYTRGTDIVFIPEPLPDVPGTAAITDWLNCSFALSDDPKSISCFFHTLKPVLGQEFFPVVERGRGLHGWKRSFNLGISNTLFAIGGQRGSAFLSIPGESCTQISINSWIALKDLLKDQYQANITRWDGAVDDYTGLHSVDWAVEQYQLDQFSTGGNKPSCSQHGNWLTPDQRGRTFEVGRRKNGKMIRIYEKGKQLGDSESLWVRWEVELHNKDRDIPWDVLTNVGGYVAGTYAVMKWVSKDASRIKTFKETASISYDHLVHHAKRAYGPLINIMIREEGSPENVIAKLIKKGKPSRLKIPVPPEIYEESK